MSVETRVRRVKPFAARFGWSAGIPQWVFGDADSGHHRLLSYNSYASRTKVNAGMVPITAKGLQARSPGRPHAIRKAVELDPYS